MYIHFIIKHCNTFFGQVSDAHVDMPLYNSNMGSDSRE